MWSKAHGRNATVCMKVLSAIFLKVLSMKLEELIMLEESTVNSGGRRRVGWNTRGELGSIFFSLSLLPRRVPVGTAAGKRSVRSRFPPDAPQLLCGFTQWVCAKQCAKNGEGEGGWGWGGTESCKSNENRCYRQHQDVNNHNSTPNFLLSGFSSQA